MNGMFRYTNKASCITYWILLIEWPFRCIHNITCYQIVFLCFFQLNNIQKQHLGEIKWIWCKTFDDRNIKVDYENLWKNIRHYAIIMRMKTKELWIPLKKWNSNITSKCNMIFRIKMKERKKPFKSIFVLKW